MNKQHVEQASYVHVFANVFPFVLAVPADNTNL